MTDDQRSKLIADLRLTAEQIGVEDVDRFIEAAVSEHDLGSDVQHFDPTPFLLGRAVLRLTHSEFARFTSVCREHGDLPENMLRRMVVFMQTQEPVPASELRKVENELAVTKAIVDTLAVPEWISVNDSSPGTTFEESDGFYWVARHPENTTTQLAVWQTCDFFDPKSFEILDDVFLWAEIEAPDVVV